MMNDLHWKTSSQAASLIHHINFKKTKTVFKGNKMRENEVKITVM